MQLLANCYGTSAQVCKVVLYVVIARGDSQTTLDEFEHNLKARIPIVGWVHTMWQTLMKMMMM